MTIEEKIGVGEKVKRYREERGWSQRELSDKTGLSRSGISKIESEAFIPTLDTIQKITEVLGVKLSDLIDLGIASDLEAVVLIDLMKIYVERKEYHHSLEHISELENRDDLLGHQKRELVLYKAESLMRTERTDEAIELLSDLRTRLEKAQAVDDHFIAEVFNRLGNAFYLSSNFTHALAYYVRAHQVAVTFAVFDLLAAKITYNLGMTCSKLKKPSEASQHLAISEQFFRGIADKFRLAETLFAQGRCYRDLNNLELAEAYLNEALALYKSQNLVEIAHQVRYSLASTVTAVFEPGLAIEQLLDCVENFKELGSMPKVAFTYSRIAELYLEKDQVNEADQFLVEARKILQSVELSKFYHDNVYGFYYKVLAKSLFKKQKYTEAIEISFKSSAHFGKIGIKRDEADSLEVAVDSYMNLGDANEAIKLSKRIIDLLRDSLDSFDNAEVIL